VKLLILAAAAHFLLSMMATIIQCRKRKRGEMRQPISYGPMKERDRIRFEYLNTRIWMNDTTCINMLRLNRDRFFCFCMIFRDLDYFKIPFICVLRNKWPCSLTQ
jgi:hypothetical protein